ncbi:hypothetical protein C8R43DRAFT_90280 [Mycena crocata]|nr:hypothetical protein C8R43DRAFT_90280 [Mycena crocata]
MTPLVGRNCLAIALIFIHIPLLIVHALHHPHIKHKKRDPLSDSGLTSASWIWTAAATTGNVAFLKTFSSAAGKTATSVTASITAVDQFTLWVNGQPIGASSDGADAWKSADVLGAALNASTNTFSVLVVNKANSGAPAPGLLAAFQIKYSDGSDNTVVSDASWAVSAVIPSDFPTPSDTSHFSSATVAAPFGSGSWGKDVALSSGDPNAPSLASSTWIWSTSDAASHAATGTVGFRKTITTPSGKTAQSATILLTVDNGFVLYINDDYVGAPPKAPNNPDFKRAEQFILGLSADSNVFTVFGENLPDPGSTDAGPAGFVATIRIRYSDGSSDVVGTDASWLSGAFTSVSAFLSTPDYALSPAFAIGTMGASPWGQLTGTSNALAAANVPSGPFDSGTVPQVPSDGGNTRSSGAGDGSISVSQTGSGGRTSANREASSESPVGFLSTATSILGGGLTSSPAQTGASSSSSGTTIVSPGSAATSSTQSSTGLVIGLVVGVLAFLAVGLGLFCWRRKRRSMRHQKALSSHLFVAASFIGDSVNSGLPRTSVASTRPAEMACVQPATSYNYPRPPVLVQGIYQQSSISRTSSPQPSRTESPQPQAIVPPSKLERESMIWQNNAAVSGARINPTSVASSGVVPPSHALTHDISRGPFDGDLDSEAEMAAPPSYYSMPSSNPLFNSVLVPSPPLFTFV